METLDYATKDSKWSIWPLRPLDIALVLVILSAIAVLFWPRYTHGRPRAPCSSYLQGLSRVIQIYAEDNHDAMPPDFETLIVTYGIDPAVLLCPMSKDTRAPSTQPTELHAALAEGGHCSYVYVTGYSSYSKLTANDIVVFERPGHHPTGGYVLFGDGHTKQLNDQELADVAQQAGSTIRPVRPRATLNTPSKTAPSS